MAKTLPVVSVICLAWCASVKPGVREQGDAVPGAQLPLSGRGGWGQLAGQLLSGTTETRQLVGAAESSRPQVAQTAAACKSDFKVCGTEPAAEYPGI